MSLYSFNGSQSMRGFLSVVSTIGQQQMGALLSCFHLPTTFRTI